MADDGAGEAAGDLAAENEALGLAVAAAHAAVWGYGVVGAALEPGARGSVWPSSKRSPTSTAPASTCPIAWTAMCCVVRKCRYHSPLNPRWRLRKPPHNSCRLC